MDIISKILQEVKLPKMLCIEQVFDRQKLEDPLGTLREGLSRPKIQNTVRPGMRIAVACGSRGITRIDEIAKTVIDYLKECGAKPFIVCAFCTPIAQPQNSMVYGPGGYKFSDYFKAGLPLTIICFVMSMILLPIFFPFY